MSIIETIKEFVGKQYLAKNLPKIQRQRKIINIDEAKNIGIIYTLENEQTYIQITQLIKTFQDKQITAKAIGFFNGNIRPMYAIERLSLDFYDTKDLNWYGKPSSTYVNDFIKAEFDILIDLSLKENFHSKYIGGSSKARFKVGKGGDFNTKYYDLMIDINNKTTLDEFISLLLHYLSIINNKNQNIND